MKKVDVTDMTVATGPNHKLFSLKANGIPLQVSCTLQEFKEEHDKTMEKVNENFRNSIRLIKLYGTMPKKPDAKKLNVWTHTDTGTAIRAKNLPLPEFIPFSF